MPWTQADLDALDAVIISGARRVRFADGREAYYHSLAELRSIRDEVAAAVDPLAGRPRVTLVAHRRDESQNSIRPWNERETGT